MTSNPGKKLKEKIKLFSVEIEKLFCWCLKFLLKTISSLIEAFSNFFFYFNNHSLFYFVETDAARVRIPSNVVTKLEISDSFVLRYNHCFFALSLFFLFPSLWNGLFLHRVSFCRCLGWKLSHLFFPLRLRLHGVESSNRGEWRFADFECRFMHVRVC